MHKKIPQENYFLKYDCFITIFYFPLKRLKIVKKKKKNEGKLLVFVQFYKIEFSADFTEFFFFIFFKENNSFLSSKSTLSSKTVRSY